MIMLSDKSDFSSKLDHKKINSRTMTSVGKWIYAIAISFSPLPPNPKDYLSMKIRLANKCFITIMPP